MTMDYRADTSPAFERHARAKRARIDATDGLGADIQAESQHLQQAIVVMSKSVEANASKVMTEVRTPHISFVPSINHRLDFEIYQISSRLSEIYLRTLSVYARNDELAGRPRKQRGLAYRHHTSKARVAIH
jgi:kinesin family protein 11